MAKCIPEQTDDGDGLDLRPKVQAVCILPEKTAPKRSADAGEVARHDKTYDLMIEFARRFERPFLLNLDAGLMPLDVEAEDSGRCYRDMRPHERHKLWGDVQDQLKAQLPAGQRVICLLTGEQLRGFVGLRFPTLCPLVGMSSPQRREWLRDILAESNFALALALAGGESVMSSVPTATSLPAGTAAK